MSLCDEADLGTPDSRADSVPRDRADSVPRDRADTVSSYDAPGKTWNGTSHLTNMSEKMIATPTSETHRTGLQKHLALPSIVLVRFA
eukprot:555476-Amphidinium_carterae.1